MARRMALGSCGRTCGGVAGYIVSRRRSVLDLELREVVSGVSCRDGGEEYHRDVAPGAKNGVVGGGDVDPASGEPKSW